MSIFTAKELLLNKTPASDVRHASHEFQAYAYRLAHDLNDLEHFKIYLRLAKNVERQLMEQAYSYVLDARTNEKGRLFLWKLKQIRNNVNNARLKLSKDYSYIIKNLKDSRDLLYKQIFIKHKDSFYTDTQNFFIEKLIKPNLNSKRKPKVLFIGLENKELLNFIYNYEFKIVGMEVSKNMVNFYKENFSQNKKNSSTKFISKDFLKNSYKDSSFDFIILNSFWKHIPENFENQYLKELLRIAKNQVYINFAKGNNDSIWEELKINDKNFDIYNKKNNPVDLENKCKAFCNSTIVQSFSDKNFLILNK